MKHPPNNIYTLNPRQFNKVYCIAPWHEWPVWLKWEWIKNRRKQHKIK